MPSCLKSKTCTGHRGPSYPPAPTNPWPTFPRMSVNHGVIPWGKCVLKTETRGCVRPFLEVIFLEITSFPRIPEVVALLSFLCGFEGHSTCSQQKSGLIYKQSIVKKEKETPLGSHSCLCDVGILHK